MHIFPGLNWGIPTEIICIEAKHLFLCFVKSPYFFFCQPYQGIIKRGYYAELTKTVKHVILVMLLAMTYLFVTQQSALYSRMAFFTTAALYLFIDYLCRIIRKWRIVNKNDIEGKRAMVLVASSSDVKETLRRLLSESVQEFFVTGIVLLDTDLTGDSIEGIPVVGNVNNVKDYLCHEWVDEVFCKAQ